MAARLGSHGSISCFVRPLHLGNPQVDELSVFTYAKTVRSRQSLATLRHVAHQRIRATALSRIGTLRGNGSDGSNPFFCLAGNSGLRHHRRLPLRGVSFAIRLHRLALLAEI